MAISDYQPVPADNKTVPGTPEIQLGYGGFGPAAHAIQTQAIQQVMADLAMSPAADRSRTFADKATAESATIPRNTLNVTTQSFSTDIPYLGGAQWRRVDSEPSHAAKFRSQDRFLPDGTISSGNGGWWEINSPIIEPAMLGVVTDNSEDQRETLIDWFATVTATQKQGVAPAGEYLCSYIDEAYTNGMQIICHPDAVFKGTVSYQDFISNGSQTVYTITDFDFYDASQGVNVDIVDPATGEFLSQLSSPSGYTRSGAVITLVSAPTSGQTIRVSATSAVIRLRGPNTLPNRILWTGGRFDCQDRAYSDAKPAGSAIIFQTWENVIVQDVFFYGCEDWVTGKTTFISDSGLGLNECLNVKVSGCFFQGWSDLGIYMTGNADLGGADDGGNISIADNWFYRCSTGLKVVRQSNNATISSNFFIECASGILQGLTGSPALPSGRGHIITGNFFKKIGRRALDLRAMPKGSIIAFNDIEDVGFMLDGTTPFYLIESASAEAAPMGMFLSGVPGSMVFGNRLGFREWATTNNQRGIQINSSLYADGSNAFPIGLAVNDNYIQGFPEGILESGADNFEACTYKDNKMDSVTTPMTVVGANTKYNYQDVATSVRWFGKGSSTWREGANTFDPVAAFGGGSATVTYSLRRASYTRNPDTDEVCLRFQLQSNMTHTETTAPLRISLPFTAVANGDDTGEAVGAVLRVIGNVTPPTGTTSWAIRAVGGANQMEIVALGNNAGLFATELRGSNITTAQNFRVDGQVTFIAA